MGGGMEVDLTHGAVAAMSRLVQGLRPVLQLADAPRPTGIVGGHTELYGILLSDGVHSQDGMLVTSLNGLVRAGLLRGGSVVRVLDYVWSNSVENPRGIAVIQLEILQTECTLIGSPTIFDTNAAQPNLRSYSDSLGIHRHRMTSRAKQGVTNIACSPDQSLSGSSNAARVEMLQQLYGILPTQNTIDAKMQQLSLKPYQSQVPSTVGGFDCPGNTYGQPIKEQNFGMLGQPDLITVVASISYVHTDAFCYPACTLMFNDKQCNKKVTANGDGWWCNRCLRSSETCDYRYLLMCQIHDHSGSSYATAFHEAAEEIIGHNAQELFTIKNNEQDDAKVEEIMWGILWREYVFKLKVKEGAGHSVMLGIVKAEKFDPSDMSRHVLGELDNLLKGNSSSAPGTQGNRDPKCQWHQFAGRADCSNLR
ncbi:hypothetical protein ACQ4PT_025796 [Festuca glaucescens]